MGDETQNYSGFHRALPKKSQIRPQSLLGGASLLGATTIDFPLLLCCCVEIRIVFFKVIREGARLRVGAIEKAGADSLSEEVGRARLPFLE